jgi:hypothetical protein
MEQKIKFDFFDSLGDLTMGNSNLNTLLMILVSIFEKRASNNAKKAKYSPKMTKN